MAEVKGLLPVLRVHPDDVAPLALVVGDPQRAAMAAGLLEGARKVGENRGYCSYTGTYRQRRVTVVSHGVGASSASVCFAELFMAGVHTVIRAGTCGALRAEIKVGDLIIATAAIREDGVSNQLIPQAYPAVADRRVVNALERAAHDVLGLPLCAGVILTQSYLYPGILPSTTRLWMRAGAVAVEMELAALLVMAGLHGVRAGGIFTVDGNLTRKAQSVVEIADYAPDRPEVRQGVASMVAIALQALVDAG